MLWKGEAAASLVLLGITSSRVLPTSSAGYWSPSSYVTLLLKQAPPKRRLPSEAIFFVLTSAVTPARLANSTNTANSANPSHNAPNARNAHQRIGQQPSCNATQSSNYHELDQRRRDPTMQQQRHTHQYRRMNDVHRVS